MTGKATGEFRNGQDSHSPDTVCYTVYVVVYLLRVAL